MGLDLLPHRPTILERIRKKGGPVGRAIGKYSLLATLALGNIGCKGGDGHDQEGPTRFSEIGLVDALTPKYDRRDIEGTWLEAGTQALGPKITLMAQDEIGGTE